MSKGKYENLVGRRYGRLKVIEETDFRQDSHIIWKCVCHKRFGGCGSILLVHTSNLTCGNTISCGCLHQEIVRGTPNSKRRAWRHRLHIDEVGTLEGHDDHA